MLTSSLLLLIPAPTQKPPADPYFSGSGPVRAVESKPVAYPMIVNDSFVSLAAWHVKGDFVQGAGLGPIESYILDAPANPPTLRFALAKAKRQIIRVSVPLDNPA